MVGIGIMSGDLLIVDRAMPIADRAIIVASIDGEFAVKRLRTKEGAPRLESAHPNYSPIAIGGLVEFHIWGVVRYAIHNVR